MTEKQAYLELYNVLNQIGVFKVLKRLDARAVTPGAIESEHETKQPG